MKNLTINDEVLANSGKMDCKALSQLVLGYDKQCDSALLEKAYIYAEKKHKEQKRASGEPYFNHPLQVACIVAGWKLDTYSVILALLHDVVEDTGTTYEEIAKVFNPEIAELTEGITKISSFEFSQDKNFSHLSKYQKQAENFRKFVLFIAKDIRVLLVKLADRLHNMRTLYHIQDSEKRQNIAQETLEIYAPLSERIGMEVVKSELQNIAFSVLHGDDYRVIMEKTADFFRGKEDLSQSVVTEIGELFHSYDLKNYQMKGRIKTPYSIWTKMQKYDISFDQLNDIVAFRVLVPSIEECYQVLGILHNHYKIIPGRFKDYISLPKSNGYKSIHTCVLGPGYQKIELQMRTFDMHESAEMGVAAHWAYKQKFDIKDDNNYAWLRQILEILDNSEGSEEFLEHTKLHVFQEDIFCLTPRGDVISLPRGSRVLDFAYAVHTKLGHQCVGAKVNRIMRPLKTLLHTGDIVEISTSKTQAPSIWWERIVKTGRARSAIRRYFRLNEKLVHVARGKALLEDSFRKEGFKFEENVLQTCLQEFQEPGLDDLYSSIVVNSKRLGDILKYYRRVILHVKETPLLMDNFLYDGDRAKTTQPYKDAKFIGLAIKFARCCHPVLGDKICGYIVTGQGITVHIQGCSQLRTLNKDNFIYLDWDLSIMQGYEDFLCRFYVISEDYPRAFENIFNNIKQAKALLEAVKPLHQSDGRSHFLVNVWVKNIDMLLLVKKNMFEDKKIYSIVRV